MGDDIYIIGSSLQELPDKDNLYTHHILQNFAYYNENLKVPVNNLLYSRFYNGMLTFSFFSL